MKLLIFVSLISLLYSCRTPNSSSVKNQDRIDLEDFGIVELYTVGRNDFEYLFGRLLKHKSRPDLVGLQICDPAGLAGLSNLKYKLPRSCPKDYWDKVQVYRTIDFLSKSKESSLVSFHAMAYGNEFSGHANQWLTLTNYAINSDGFLRFCSRVNCPHIRASWQQYAPDYSDKYGEKARQLVKDLRRAWETWENDVKTGETIRVLWKDRERDPRGQLFATFLNQPARFQFPELGTGNYTMAGVSTPLYIRGLNIPGKTLQFDSLKDEFPKISLVDSSSSSNAIEQFYSCDVYRAGSPQNWGGVRTENNMVGYIGLIFRSKKELLYKTISDGLDSDFNRAVTNCWNNEKKTEQMEAYLRIK